MASNRNTIKGLTVEIGGDTTKLGKALESVNKKSDELSAELGEINRLLKFNPDDTDLLAQKQKVLAEAVSNTSEKLDTLKTAEAQVQEQFERGEVSEAQVRALQREIVATTGKLNSYEKAILETAEATGNMGTEATEASGKTKKLQKTLSQQESMLADLKARYDSVVASQGSNSTVAQLLRDDIAKLSQEIQNNKASLDKAASSADKASNSMSKMAGAAKVGLQAVAAGATAAIGALVGSAEATREYRTEMGKLSAAFTSSGHSSETATDAYKTLYGVIGETDQSVEAAQQIALLADSAEDVTKWAGLASGVVGKFGDALQPETFFEAANETLKLGEATGAYTQMLEGVGMNVDEFNAGLAACNTEAEKQAYLLEVTETALGSAGEAYEKNNAELIRANEANEAWTATLALAGAAVEPILTDVKLLGAALLTDLMPGITGVTDAFRGFLSGDEGAGADLGAAVGDLLGNIITKASELIPNIVQVGLSLVVSLTESIVAEIPNLVNATTQVLIDSVPVLIEGAKTLLMAVVDAIALILPPLVDALPQIIVTLVDGLMSAIPTLIDGAVTLLGAIISAIPIFIQKLLPRIPTIVASIVSGLLGAIPKLIEAGGQLLAGLVEGMLNFDFMGAISGIGNSIVEGFKSIFGIHSPSRVMAGIGGYLDEGLAEGIIDGAAAPVNALDKLSGDMLDSVDALNGVTVARQVSHTYGASGSATATDGISVKLDQIYKAILSGQVIMLDGKTLVGSTAVRYDNELGQRRALAERGAI